MIGVCTGGRSGIGPSDAVLAAFGLNGSPVPLAGGQGTASSVDAVVLKPLDMEPAMMAWQHSLLAGLAGRGDFRVSVPLHGTDGSLIAHGWTAWRYEPGDHRERSWQDIIAVGRRLHHALEAEPEPSFLHARMDQWSIGDKVAWGDLPATDYAAINYLSTLVAALEPVDARCQLIHGDLSGNVLFDDDLPPLVIDLSPYWRPPAFASAIVIVDAMAFEGAGADVIEPLLDDPDVPQYLLRAVIYRAVTDHLARPHPRRDDADDPYLPAVELALQLTEHR